MASYIVEVVTSQSRESTIVKVRWIWRMENPTFMHCANMQRQNNKFSWNLTPYSITFVDTGQPNSQWASLNQKGAKHIGNFKLSRIVNTILRFFTSFDDFLNYVCLTVHLLVSKWLAVLSALHMLLSKPFSWNTFLA